MGSLWTTSDVLKQFRLNRTALLPRLGMPMHDVDGSDVVTVEPITVGVALGNVIGDVWAVPGGIAVACVTSITITNTDVVARTPSVYLIEPTQSAVSVARTIWNDPIPASESVTVDVPFSMAPGATIRGLASVTGVIAVRVNALMFDAQPAGISLVIFEGVALTNALATYYTCPAVQQAILLASVFCNTDTVLRTPELHLVPNGGAAAVANKVYNSPLVPKETAARDANDVLVEGDFIRAKADVTSVVSMRLSILEVE